jgi:hypothetical protein
MSPTGLGTINDCAGKDIRTMTAIVQLEKENLVVGFKGLVAKTN